MHALIYEGPRKVVHKAVAQPVPLPDESLVRIDAAGICGSDIHVYSGHDTRRNPGAVLGHEGVGHIASGIDKGTRVVVFPSIHCGVCKECRERSSHHCLSRQQIGLHRQGMFAEYAVIPRKNLIEIDSRLSDAAAAVVEPLAVAIRAVGKATSLQRESLNYGHALIVGGGSIGLLSALLLQRRSGMRVTLCDTHSARRMTCHAAGVGQVLAAADVPGAGPFDLIVDAVGSAASRRLSQAEIARSGMIIHVGLREPFDGVDFQRLTREEVTVAGSIRASQTEFQEAIELLSSGAIGSLDWIEQRPLSEGPDAFNDLAEGRVRAAKVVLIP